jgi:polysaccharide export outer membrane protein
LIFGKHGIMRSGQRGIVPSFISALYFIFCLSGCSDKFLDPTQIGRFRTVPAVNVILDSLGVSEEAPSVWVGAEEPKPVDVIAYEADYTFGPGDVVRISIFELLQEGIPFENAYVVTETGKISIPQVGVVEAAGLTESQLEEEIRQILSPSILKEPSVTVSLANSERRTFSISGDGVPRPGRYEIPRYDFRLLDALATAGGVSQFNSSYVYVSRPVTGREPMAEPCEPAGAAPAEPVDRRKEMLEIIAPHAKQWRHQSMQELVISSTEMTTGSELADVISTQDFGPQSGETGFAEKQEPLPDESGRETIEEPIDEAGGGRIEWIFQDGRWIPVRVGTPAPAEPKVRAVPEEKLKEPLQKRIPEALEWSQIGEGGVQARVVKIDAERLRSGDPKYNVVIRAGDSIQVPVDMIGEFCIMGNTNFQGFVSLLGRPMTLKMAIAAAGGLGPLAWPKRCEVVRRIGKDKEEIVMVDLEKIAAGEQPDFFIKPNDTINVGTHVTARWRAVLRNAFRATYGFGFVYDRNFADRDFGTSRPFGSIVDHIEDIF